MDEIRSHPNLAGIDVDHIIVASTHAHNTPDTIGLWGPQATTTGRVASVLPEALRPTRRRGAKTPIR